VVSEGGRGGRGDSLAGVAGDGSTPEEKEGEKVSENRVGK